MDKITKVQEINSFIRHFDNKFWNEIVLHLTIIGIRYIKNFCKNYFKWRMDDLSLILEDLKQNKSITPNIYKTNINYGTNSNNKYKNHFNRNENNTYNYNYNYSNTAFLKKDSKEKLNKKYNNNKNDNKAKSLLSKTSMNNFHNNKKYYINKIINNDNEINYNRNNSMLILSDRESLINNSNINQHRKSLGKIKETSIKKKIDKQNCNNTHRTHKYNKNCLKFYEKDEEIEFSKSKKNNNRNKILSLNKKDLFNNNNMDINIIVSDFPFNNKNINKINKKNDNNYFYEKNMNNNKDKNHSEIKNEIKNNFNNSCILQNSYCIENEYNKNNNDLIDEIKKGKENFHKNSLDFISELRKMSKSKEKNRKQPNFSEQTQIFNLASPILKVEKNDGDMNKENNILRKVNITPTININNNKESDVFLNFNNINNKDNILSKTINRMYNINSKKENIDLNCNYNYNTYNSIDNMKNSKPNYNKYLRNPNYKNKKSRTNSIDDLTKIISSSSAYICPSKKENENNNIKSKINKYNCHYFYESKL